jgi:hypothetical protein
MSMDLRRFAVCTAIVCVAAGASGGAGGLSLGAVSASAQQSAGSAAAVIAGQAARAVLSGVGLESSLTSARVDRALVVLAGSVAEQSDPAALRLAFQAYYSYRAAHPEKVRKPYLYFVDYGLDARTPRGYVFDMNTLRVVEGPFTVAHGRGSAPTAGGVPTRFSNAQGSNATSLGLYLAQEVYAFRGRSAGRAYTSPGLRLAGVSGKYNSAARARGVVMHGAPYVTPAGAGRSEGCPAVEMDRAERLIPRIANGGMVFLFSPLDRAWMAEDRWAGLGIGSGRG